MAWGVGARVNSPWAQQVCATSPLHSVSSSTMHTGHTDTMKQRIEHMKRNHMVVIKGLIPLDHRPCCPVTRDKRNTRHCAGHPSLTAHLMSTRTCTARPRPETQKHCTGSKIVERNRKAGSSYFVNFSMVPSSLQSKQFLSSSTRLGEEKS
jgi:hypothetical protein